ncbi:divergent protein kinase domain 2B [Camelus ferus]|uniref:Divergent protein kinase domain 2B n=1 Tax=Camelus ferus TaxID=419612 RepID=A0A8B8SJY3_CAMFR|nr:divergent protein kinase domain 2B [Camelus ferus]
MEPWLGPEAAGLRLGWPALLLWVSSLSYSVSLPASLAPSLVPRVRISYNFGRTFLGLDKCNACIGTSICKKFFKEEIRSESQSDNSEGHSSVPFTKPPSCKSVAESKFIQLASRQANKSGDELLASFCPLVVRGRERERVGRGLSSVFFSLIFYCLLLSAWQIFPGAEGWPLPKYVGSCGRLLVSTSTSPLQEFYGAPPDQAADLAYQLLGVLESLRSNDLNYFFYFTRVDAAMFGIFNNGHLFIRDASALGVIDRQEGSQAATRAEENKDIFSCLVSGCQVELPSCDTVPEKQSLVLVCEQVLPRLLQAKFPSPVQEEIDAALARCGEGARPDSEVLGAARQLKDILRPLRTCDPRFAYRYPDCKYDDKF